MQTRCVFVGDSPNDEPMFEFFKNSFAVGNFREFEGDVKHKPSYITERNEGEGFAEIAEHIIQLKVGAPA